METDLLNYHLPTELIAQHPCRIRTDSRLLVYNRPDGKLIDSRFSRIGDFLSAGDCLVLNDTKVLQARFFARRNSGAKLQGLFLSEDRKGLWQVMLKGAGKVKIGEKIHLMPRENGCDKGYTAVLVEKTAQGGCLLKIETDNSTETVLERVGFPPLPPYIKRNYDRQQAALDKIRNQTVFARSCGAVAAPTAGLHFSGELIEELKDKGIHFAYITLHVGAGTFKPVTKKIMEDHKFLQERF